MRKFVVLLIVGTLISIASTESDFYTPTNDMTNFSVEEYMSCVLGGESLEYCSCVRVASTWCACGTCCDSWSLDACMRLEVFWLAEAGGECGSYCGATGSGCFDCECLDLAAAHAGESQ